MLSVTAVQLRFKMYKFKVDFTRVRIKIHKQMEKTNVATNEWRMKRTGANDDAKKKTKRYLHKKIEVAK